MQTVLHHAPCCRWAPGPSSRRCHVGPSRRSTGIIIAQATVASKSPIYRPPSSATAASELEALSRYSVVVPDTVLMQRVEELELQAATVSSAVLTGILRNPAGMREYEVSIERAMRYDKCAREAGDAKLACELDKALVNVGTLFAQQIPGRVSTEVDPRLSFDQEALVARAHNLLAEYKDNGVPQDKVLIRLPATWQGIQAAKQLESEGVATHVVLIYSFVQAAAAAQAGVSVIQPNIGRIEDWYRAHPGYPRPSGGPRTDAGSLLPSEEHPGVQLVQKIFNYVKQRFPKTRIMAAGVRSKDDALALAGVDFMVLSGRVVEQLDRSPTMQGYNDGLSADLEEAEGVTEQLSAATAEQAHFTADEQTEVTQQLFEEGLGMAGLELLEAGIRLLVSDTEQLEPTFERLAIESF